MFRKPACVSVYCTQTPIHQIFQCYSMYVISPYHTPPTSECGIRHVTTPSTPPNLHLPFHTAHLLVNQVLHGRTLPGTERPTCITHQKARDSTIMRLRN